MAIAQNIRKLLAAVRSYGIGGAVPYFESFRRKRRDKRDYQKWIIHNSIDDDRREEMRQEIKRFDSRPLISIILPVYDVDEIWLRKCIDSVIAQTYPKWEFCIADDASKRAHVRRLLDEYVSSDERIKVVFRPENGHISAASNSALEIASGEFSVLLDHDDELTEDALFWVAKELNDHTETAMIYSDEDLIDENGLRSDPKFKPDFSRDLMYSLNVVTHLSAYRTELLRKVGGFRIGLEGSQDYDLALRVIEQIPETAIRHIPRVLYHWRTIPTSVAGDAGAKPYAFAKARDAIHLHFERTGVNAAIVAAEDDLNRVKYILASELPSVTIIVSGGSRAGLLDVTDYPNLEVIETDDSEATAERLNTIAAAVNSEVLCFLDGSLRPLSADWLSEMVSFAVQPKIGIVGAKLLRSNGSIDQTGFILGGPEIVRPAHRGYPRSHHGNFFRAGLIGNYSAVSGRCMAIRRCVFDSIGGFDSEHYSQSLFDADLCLRLSESGFRIVYTPYAELIETSRTVITEPDEKEIDYFSRRWQAVLKRDPFYNPNFTDQGEPFKYRV